MAERAGVELKAAAALMPAEASVARQLEASRQFQRSVENVGQNAPVSSEAAIAFLKQIITFANTAHDSVRKAAKQTVDFAQSSESATTEAASETTASASPAVEKTEKVAKH